MATAIQFSDAAEVKKIMDATAKELFARDDEQLYFAVASVASAISTLAKEIEDLKAKASQG